MRSRKCKWTFHRDELSVATFTFCRLSPMPLHCVFHICTKKKKTRGGRPDGGKNKKRNTSHQVRLHCLADGTICKSVLSATRSRTAPRRTMSAARRTIRHRLFYPRCPLTLSTRLLIHTHTHYVYNTHTHSGLR